MQVTMQQQTVRNRLCVEKVSDRYEMQSGRSRSARGIRTSVTQRCVVNSVFETELISKFEITVFICFTRWVLTNHITGIIFRH